MRVIIACAGREDDPKWGGYLGVPKHLAPVEGRPLLARTVDQVSAYATDAVITAPRGDARYCLPGAATVHPDRQAANEYAGSRPWWNPAGRTVLLLGDVFFTVPAMHAILGYDGAAPCWFGRFGPSRVTASSAGELFAVSWLPDHHDDLDRHLARVATRPDITRPAGWKLYRSYHRLPMHRHRRGRHWREINDLTDDFDTPARYDAHPCTPDRAPA